MNSDEMNTKNVIEAIQILRNMYNAVRIVSITYLKRVRMFFYFNYQTEGLNRRLNDLNLLART